MGSSRVKRGLTSTCFDDRRLGEVPATDGLPTGTETDPDAGTRRPRGYAVRDRVVFESDGIAGSGAIDDVMPDGSVVWVWPDDAMGRKMLFAADALSVRHEHQSHKLRTF